MPGILKESISGGYKKSISTPSGVITAIVENGGIYIERQAVIQGGDETENMGIALLMQGIRVNENNLDAALVHLYEQEV